MDKIQEKTLGSRELLRFTNSQNSVGELIFDNEGFRFKGQVGQEVVTTITANGSMLVNCRDGNLFYIKLEGASSLTLMNAIPGTYTFILKQDSTGGRVLTFPGYYLVADSSGVPDFTTSSADQIDIVSIMYDGSTYYVTTMKNMVRIDSL